MVYVAAAMTAALTGAGYLTFLKGCARIFDWHRGAR